MKSEQLDSLNKNLKYLRKEYREVRKNFNNLIYDIAQLNVWLFLATMAAVSISDGKYRSISLVMTGVFFVYQLHLLSKLKLDTEAQIEHLDSLRSEVQVLDKKMNEIGYEAKRSENERLSNSDSSLNLIVFIPMLLNVIFYLYTLKSNIDLKSFI